MLIFLLFHIRCTKSRLIKATESMIAITIVYFLGPQKYVTESIREIKFFSLWEKRVIAYLIKNKDYYYYVIKTIIRSETILSMMGCNEAKRESNMKGGLISAGGGEGMKGCCLEEMCGEHCVPGVIQAAGWGNRGV